MDILNDAAKGTPAVICPCVVFHIPVDPAPVFGMSEEDAVRAITALDDIDRSMSKYVVVMTTEVSAGMSCATCGVSGASRRASTGRSRSARCTTRLSRRPTLPPSPQRASRRGFLEGRDAARVLRRDRQQVLRGRRVLT